MSTDILHTADTHLGYRQYHKPEREEDFREAFETVVTAAIERDVDAVVHSGDLFDRSRPSINALSELVAQLNRLRDAGIEFCTIVGNHDSTRDREWPAFLEDIGLAVYLGYEGHVIGDVTLYGQDYVDRGQRSRLDYQFKPVETEKACLVAHGLFTPFPHGDWDMGELLTRSTVDFDALLLGDDHKPQIESIDDTPITYPGSTERTAADQREKRGYNVISVDDGISIAHETIDTRTFRYIDIEMGTDSGTEEVLERVEAEQVPDGSVLIVTLSGDGSRVTTADVERTGERSGALVVRVNDRREFTEVETELRDVTIEDPEDAVKERKPELGLSAVADELEETARDLGGVAKSNLKSLSEEQVEDFLDEREPDAFVANGDSDSRFQEGPETDAGDEASTSGTESGSQEGTETNGKTGTPESNDESGGTSVTANESNEAANNRPDEQVGGRGKSDAGPSDDGTDDDGQMQLSDL